MNFDQVVNRRHTNSIKWDRYGDALPLWVADMDFSAPEPVLEALRQRVEHGVFGYTLPPAELYRVVQVWLKERYNWKVERRAIRFLPGVMRGVNMLARAVGQPGDGILVQPPVYYPFFDVPKNSGRVLQQAQVPQVNGHYQIDFPALEATITQRTRLFLLCNPHNPIGRVYTRPELAQLAEICLRHNLIICSDEIHSDLIFSGHQHIPIATLSPEVTQRTVTVFAPSKTFNLPGLACSVMIIQNPTLRKEVLAAGAGLVHGSNIMGYTAALAAYRHGAEWLAQLLRYLQANRDYLSNFVQTRLPGLRMVKPEGTYLAWLNCRAADLPNNPHQFFLDQAQVALNNGARFGPGGKGFVRLNFGCPRATLAEALERMENALVKRNS